MYKVYILNFLKSGHQHKFDFDVSNKS